MSSDRSPRRLGCALVLGLVAAALVIIATLLLVAAWQIHATVPVPHALAEEVSPTAGDREPVRVRLVVDTAALVLLPAPTGTPVRVTGEHDPRRYTLSVRRGRDADGPFVTIDLRPAGWRALALLRVKLGGEAPTLRVWLPRGARFDLEAELERCYAAMELGGLSLASVRVKGSESGALIGFSEPLADPLDLLDLDIATGALFVRQVGNASPSRTRIVQQLGALELDLRGAWVRDGAVSVRGRLGGGTLWLPDDVEIAGFDRPGGNAATIAPEVPLPRVTIEIDSGLGQLVVADERDPGTTARD